MDIEKIVNGLLEQGLDVESAVKALQEMLQKGEITEEDLANAVELLKNKEKELAEKMYGMSFEKQE